MVTNQSLDLLFGALADPTRRVILDRLTRGESTVGELAKPFDMTRPAISKHLKVLERAGLVRRCIDGRVTRCSLDAAPLREASDFVERYRDYWEGQLDRFASYLEEKAEESDPPQPSEEESE